jgi:hypothetical protein
MRRFLNIILTIMVSIALNAPLASAAPCNMPCCMQKAKAEAPEAMGGAMGGCSHCKPVVQLTEKKKPCCNMTGGADRVPATLNSSNSQDDLQLIQAGGLSLGFSAPATAHVFLSYKAPPGSPPLYLLNSTFRC